MARARADGGDRRDARRRLTGASAALATLLVCVTPTALTAAATEGSPESPCLTLAALRFREHTYLRAQTQSSRTGYAAEYYRKGERPSAWSTRLELRSYARTAGGTPAEVAAGVIALERSSNPALRAAPVALNAEQSVVLLDYLTWSDSTLHAGYVEIDVFKFFVPVARDSSQVLGFRFVRKLPITDRSRDMLTDEIRRERIAAVQAMLQLPLCAWTVTEPADSA